MDKYTADKEKRQLLGQKIGGWLIKEYINHGKSALVFLASKAGKKAALKVFDPEIIKRYGPDAQRQRIEREKKLIGKSHPNSISVYDGGEQGDYFFIAMEYFDGKNLAEVLKDIPTTEVRSLIAQIALGAQFLEDNSFAHRDIKPENIGISKNMKSAKLLDFGVLRPLDLSNITDQGDQRYFIGTLQYSPPELLFREEEQSIEAWRAISFYQLGAVLHDLLMRKQLFEKFVTPYARLVRAVEKEIPLIDNPKADADLRLLAQNCLAKDPNHRLDTVTWEDFNQEKITNPVEVARKKIAQHRMAAAQKIKNPVMQEDLLRTQIFTLSTLIFSAVVSTTKSENLPRYRTHLIGREQHPYLLRVLFEPSKKDDLTNYIAIYCQGSVLDSVANFYELRIWACIGSKRRDIPELDSGAPCRVLKGALIEQDIRHFIHETLLIVYSEALDASAKDLGSAQWLKLGEKA